MNKLYLLLLLTFFHLSIKAQTIVVSASQDNTIYSDFPLNSNGAGENFTTGSVGTAGSYRRALIRFDLSAVPAGATITTVTLNLTMNKTISAGVNVSLHPLAVSWGEGTSDAGVAGDGQGVPATTSDATWPCSFAVSGGGCVTPWTLPGADFVSTASATTVVGSVGAYSWSSTQMVADIQGWVDAPTTNFGWIIKGEEVALRSAKRFDSRTSSNVAARPSLSITYTTVAPVTLRYFKAQSQKYGNLLKWETEQEFNNDHFVIEHSLDGRVFSPIGQVKGAGSSSTPIAYQYIHQATEPGRNFYRLVQVDFNNAKHYSTIVAVSMENRVTDLLVSPNPVTDKINLPGLAGNGNKFQVININGQKLLEGNIFGSQINVNGSIKPGMYQLIIYAPDGAVRTARFLKQ